MTFSRPIPESRSLVDIEGVLDSTIKLAWSEIRDRARLIKRYGQVPRVRGDEARLVEVFLNLILSAARSMDPETGGGEIVLTTKLDGDQVLVEILDTGASIHEQDLPRVFEPSFTRKVVGGGEGLALSTCKSIVTSHGGDISVESGPERGATFRVSLPKAAGAPSSRPPPSVEGPGPYAQRARILVIDDEPLLGQTLGFAFSGRHDVVVTTSGRQALALLAEDAHFDLILCDLMMPDVTGQKVFETIEQQHPGLVGHFVFMTGGAFTESAQSFLESHPGHRIEKPFTIGEIERLLLRLQPEPPAGA